MMTVLFFVTALIYSLAGHAGASLYTPLARLTGMSAMEARSAALILNLGVSGIALALFAVAGHLRIRLIAPFLLGSLPFCFFGSRLLIHSGAFDLAMGLALIGAACRIAWVSKSATEAIRVPSMGQMTVAGAALGLLSGLTGIGGGIYLSSLMLFKRWASAHETAAAAACFIFANSAVSLWASGVSAMPRPEWLALCLLGGALGALLGSRLLSPRALWRSQAAVALLAAFKLLALP